MSNKSQYCRSRFQTIRNNTRVVNIGSISIGGDNPIRIQSMTNTPTEDVKATVKQSIALAEAGCEIVRITAPNIAAAKALKEIRKEFSAAGFSNIPLVADIHFLPKAAMEAIEHVEKVRVNPGNYADKKKFAIHEYSDAAYALELERLHEAFSPLVKRAKELGRALRIGTNHGSLSDRIMNRYGDSPLGMAESALEFIRIAESHGYQDIVLSMKASNPKVMIQAYRLVVAKMNQQGMHYPLHLGVTEAGDGEDARIKSAIGIGSLLADGLGDTIRVSLTEDPVYEIPVAQDLAKMAHKLWVYFPQKEKTGQSKVDALNPYEYTRREIQVIEISNKSLLKEGNPPPVIIKTNHPLSDYEKIAKDYLKTNNKSGDTKIEGLMLSLKNREDLAFFAELQNILATPPIFYALEVDKSINLEDLRSLHFTDNTGWILCRRFEPSDKEELKKHLAFTKLKGVKLAIDTNAECLANWSKLLKSENHILITTSIPEKGMHATGTYRALAQVMDENNVKAPIWIRNTPENTIDINNYFTSRLLESSVLSGSLLCDGLGDVVSIETEPDLERAMALNYSVLQGARLRMSKTEFVACPSCGRTLFDLETTTQGIREKTGHLKGVTIAIMGCIVNGPGEMADADFGYVGGAPGKINLYVGKECVQYHIPQEEAVERLIDLIKSHNKWVEPNESTVNT